MTSDLEVSVIFSLFIILGLKLLHALKVFLVDMFGV